MDIATLSIKVDSTSVPPATDKLGKLADAGAIVENAIKAAAAAWAGWNLIQYARDAATLAARYDTLGVVMRVVGNNAGYSGSQMEAYALSLQKTGISMVESRNTLSMMASAHIDLANASKLGRVAQDAAVIGNINSSEAFQRMIYGIQSGQVEILRTIGINVNFEQSYKKLALQLGKNAASLTETEKAQARTNAVMEKGQDIAGAYAESLGTVGKAAKSMERIWENLQVILGGVFQEGFKVVVDGMTTAMQSATEWAGKFKNELTSLGTAMADAAREGGEFSKMLAQVFGGSGAANKSVGVVDGLFRALAIGFSAATDAGRAFFGHLELWLGASIQHVGRFADALPNLFGFSGKGSIRTTGEDIAGNGQKMLDDLKAQTNTGTLMDKWLDDQSNLVAKAKKLQDDARSLLSGASAGTNALMASHATGAEASKIAAGILDRAEETKRLLAAAAALESAKGTKAQTGAPGEDSGFMYFSIQERDIQSVEVATTKALEFSQALRSLQDTMRSFNQVQSWADPLAAGIERLKKDRADLDANEGLLGAEAYRKGLEVLRMDLMKLKAQNGDTWAIIGQTVVQNSGRASDALVDWMNKTNDVARTWSTLGDTVKDVIRDMLIQMQKQIVMTQMLKLATAASTGSNWSWLTGLFGGGTGTTPTTGGSAGGGLNWGEANIANPGGGASAKGGSSGDVSITINNTGGGATADVQGGGQAAIGLSRMVLGVVNQWADEQSRVGGRLARS